MVGPGTVGANGRNGGHEGGEPTEAVVSSIGMDTDLIDDETIQRIRGE